MASTSSTPLSLSSPSSTLFEGKAPRQLSAAASSQCATTLPTLPPPLVQSQTRGWKTTTYCQKIARNVVAMATGEAPAEVAVAELPDIVKTIQETWDKVEDKYAVSSLAVAGVVALSASAGMISAIDRLPLVPGVLELVGIGYTGAMFDPGFVEGLVNGRKWFAYRNLIFKPDREALIQKIKVTYNDILGSS